MKAAIPDDWFDTLLMLQCLERLDGHDMTVVTDHVPETESLAERLQGFEALVGDARKHEPGRVRGLGAIPRRFE